MVSTRPALMISRQISSQSHCESERPTVSGNSQASFTMWIATSGGKAGLASAARQVVESLDACFQIASTPIANMFVGHPDAFHGFAKREPIGDTEDRSGSFLQTGLNGSRPSQLFEFVPLLNGQFDNNGTFSTTHTELPCPKSPPSAVFEHIDRSTRIAIHNLWDQYLVTRRVSEE